MNFIKSALLTTATFALMTGSALAADPIILSGIQGGVMVNQGESYATATNGMTVAPDNLVMVNEGGFAKLTYPSGCVLEVTGEYLLTVAEDAPCAAGVPLATVGGGAAASTGAYVAAGVLGVAVAAAIIDDDDDDDQADDNIDDDTGSSAGGSGTPEQPRPPISQ